MGDLIPMQVTALCLTNAENEILTIPDPVL